MIFEVEISTIVTKKVRVNAEDLSSAEKIARFNDEKGFYANVCQSVTDRKYNASLTCPRCGRNVMFFYQDEANNALCLPCYRDCVRGWQLKVPAAL